MEPDWTLEDFLGAASKRLQIFPIAKRVFNADGERWVIDEMHKE